MIRAPYLAGPRLAAAALPAGQPPTYRLAADRRGALFWALELTLYRPSGTAPPTVPGWLTAPRLALAPLPVPVEAWETLRASDLGYRTPARDPAAPAVLVYPPRLDAAFELDRALALPPDQAGVAVGWGTVRLANPRGELDRLATLNADGRSLRLLAGRKAHDAARGLDLDPSYAALVEAGSGVAAGLQFGEAVLEVLVRDAAYWLERPLQANAYGGTGGADGTADLAGRPKPKARGGTVAAPIRGIAPVAIDPLKRIFQWTDAPGQVVTLYEGGLAGNIGYAGDTGDLWSGSVAGGYYRTDNARGLLQLGAEPVRPITLDGVGLLPDGGAAPTAAALALALLQRDLGLPAELLDVDSFLGLDAACPWVAGRWWDGSAGLQADAALGELLVSLGARLVPTRRGRLRALALRAPVAGERPVGTLGPEVWSTLRPRPLPDSLAPPIYRARVGYARQHVVQTSDLAPTVSAAERARLAAEFRYAVAAAPTNTLAAYRRPNDGPLVASALQLAADAQSLAEAQAALWGAPRRLFDATLPLDLALRFDLGSLIVLSAPTAGLAAGALGHIVGEQLRSRDGAATLTILV